MTETSPCGRGDRVGARDRPRVLRKIKGLTHATIVERHVPLHSPPARQRPTTAETPGAGGAAQLSAWRQRRRLPASFELGRGRQPDPDTGTGSDKSRSGSTSSRRRSTPVILTNLVCATSAAQGDIATYQKDHLDYAIIPACSRDPHCGARRCSHWV